MNTLQGQDVITVLIVDDNPGDVRLVREALKEADPEHINVLWVGLLAEAVKCLAAEQVDVVLLDLSLPDVTGLETFQRMQLTNPHIPIVVLTGSYDEGLAIQAVRAGAQDYLLKQNFDSHLLLRVLRYAIERKRAGEAVRNALVKEKHLNELKTRFVSMVSHDFRTPLASILSSSDLLRNYSQRMTDERKQKHFETIQLQIKHLTDLLEDTLTLTKAQSIGMEFNPILTDLLGVCQTLVDEMQPLAGTRTIQLVVDGEVDWVRLDPQLLRRILINLLTNAVKYSSEGSAIELTVARESERMMLRIQDHGIGIPEADQARLFEVFHRAKNVGGIPGTGLGLAIVKLAVEAHGGTITVDSQVNVGTAVTIFLPLSIEEAETP